MVLVYDDNIRTVYISRLQIAQQHPYPQFAAVANVNAIIIINHPSIHPSIRTPEQLSFVLHPSRSAFCCHCLLVEAFYRDKVPIDVQL